MPNSNATWKYEYSDCCCPSPNIDPIVRYNYQFKILGDTAILGQTYSKLFYEELNISCPLTFPGSYTFTYQGGMRNDTLNKRVYFCPNGATVEGLALDFSLNVGDTLPIAFHDTINKIDSVLIGGSYRKQFCTTLGDSIIEGIGQVIENCFLRYFMGLHQSPYSGFICFTNNSTTFSPFGNCPTIANTLNVTAIEQSKNDIEIFPNPTSGIFTIESTFAKLTSIKIMNVLGECVYHSEIRNSKSEINLTGVSKGIYFLQANTADGIVNKKIMVE